MNAGHHHGTGFGLGQSWQSDPDARAFGDGEYSGCGVQGDGYGDMPGAFTYQERGDGIMGEEVLAHNLDSGDPLIQAAVEIRIGI